MILNIYKFFGKHITSIIFDIGKLRIEYHRQVEPLNPCCRLRFMWLDNNAEFYKPFIWLGTKTRRIYNA